MTHRTNTRGLLLSVGLAFSAIPLTQALGQVIDDDLKILASDPVHDDQFGTSVSIHNGVVAVGAARGDRAGADSGSAALFDATNGTLIHTLTPTDGDSGAEFGNSIAMDGNMVAVGAWRDDENGEDSGAVYLFDASTGAQLYKLMADFGEPGAAFGHAVAIEGNTVVVGAHQDDENGTASGAVYTFNADSGAQTRKIMPADGSTQDWFGYSVAIDGGIIAAGSIRDGDVGFWAGSAYLFDAATGVQTRKLLPTDGTLEDRFGHSIDIDGDTVAVGMLFQGNNGYRSGAAYLFDTSTGAQRRRLLANDGRSNDWFGSSIAVSGGVVAIGAQTTDDNGLQSGSAYLFDTGTAKQISKMLPRNGDQGHQFGNAIALEGGVAVVGSLYADEAETRVGSVHVFEWQSRLCPADFNRDGFLDNDDLGRFASGFIEGNIAADMNGDGLLDLGDIGAFIEAFLSGC